MNVQAYNEGFAQWCKQAGVDPAKLIKFAQTRSVKPLPTRPGAGVFRGNPRKIDAPDKPTIGDIVSDNVTKRQHLTGGKQLSIPATAAGLKQKDFDRAGVTGHTTPPKLPRTPVAPTTKRRTKPLGRLLNKQESMNYSGPGRVTYRKGKAYEVK
jgi:hypothetical protein